METYLKGRVRNFSLKPKRCLLPVFEAVMNSIQAIEDRASANPKAPPGRIEVTIIRRQTQKELLQSGNLPHVVDVQVKDNGVGFDDQHLTAFSRLDDDFRIAKGGKGVGRVSWLAAFERVSVESVYQADDGKRMRRSFEYSITADGVKNAVSQPADPRVELGTTISLQSLKFDFQEAWPKKANTVLERLVLHFQRFLALPNCPEIVVHDSAVPNPAILGDYFRNQFQIDRLERSISVGAERFEVVHLLHRASGDPSEQHHTIWMLANGRPAEEAQTIPVGHGIPKGPIRHGGQSLYYTAFVSGELLDQSANETRTHVDLASSSDGSLYADEVTREDIVTATAKSGIEFLGDRLADMYSELEKRIEAICIREIRYRPLLTHCKEQLKRLEPSLPDPKLEDAINSIYRDYMNGLRERTRNVSKRARLHIDDLAAFEVEVKAIIGSWNEAAMSDLAAYVAHRRAVLWFLQDRLKYTNDDSYRFEEAVHAVFFPMGFDSERYPVDAANLWLIDERLSFHEYLASDMALRNHKLLENESGSELDIAVYHAAHAFGAAELPRMSLTLVEFKRPGRDKYSMEDNPYTQAINYIEDIRHGKAKLRDGRPISDVRSVHFFVYLICDRSEALHRILKAFTFKETCDGRGYFKHTDDAYFEVVTFDKLVDDAISRNKVLFDKLNLPATAGDGFASNESGNSSAS